MGRLLGSERSSGHLVIVFYHIYGFLTFLAPSAHFKVGEFPGNYFFRRQQPDGSQVWTGTHVSHRELLSYTRCSLDRVGFTEAGHQLSPVALLQEKPQVTDHVFLVHTEVCRGTVGSLEDF